MTCPRRFRGWNHLLGAVVALGLAAALSPAAPSARAQMLEGENMLDFDKVFDVKIRQRQYDFRPVLIAATAPANILHPGEQARFTLQLVSETDEPIAGDFFVDLIGYGTQGIPGDIWKPRVHQTTPTVRIPIRVDLPKKDAYQNFVIEPVTPDAFGAYALVVDLGPHGRRFATSYIRTFKPAFQPPQYPQLCLDAEDPVTLTRLNAAPNRIGVPYIASDDPNVERERGRIADRLREYKAAGLPITVEFGAGRDHGPTQPLGRARPHLDEDGVLLETKQDMAWLPKYDADFREYVRSLCVEFGWPRGPVNGVMLWNEPWEGISISGWGADTPRYREITVAMAEGVEDARREAGVQVLIGGCDSSSNTIDKLFGDGSDTFLKWLDFCSIHYQGMQVPSLMKAWREREHPNGRVLIWDTESWVANTDDRVAAVVATNLATGHDRAVGIYHGNIVSFAGSPWFDAAGKRQNHRYQNTWSVAAAVGAANHFIGPRPFRELLFRNGLPWVIRFDGPPAGARLDNPTAPVDPDLGTLVIVGDIGEAFGPENIPFRTAKGVAERVAKKDLAYELAALAAQADAASKEAFEKKLAEWDKRAPLAGGTLTLADPDRRFRLYDFQGNALAAENAQWIVPLDHRGFYLTSDGTPGSFAALCEAVRAARVDGIQPFAVEVLDFLAPIEKRPELRVRLTNVLNRPVAGTVSLNVAGLSFADASRAVAFAANETKTLAFAVIDGVAAPDNRYPLAFRFEGDGEAQHFETVRVNHIPRRSIQVDGELRDWDGVIPQPILAGGSGPTLTERAWEPYRKFETTATTGFAVGYVAHDADNFYFAARVVDATPHPGTLRLATRDDDQFYYPAVSYQIDPDKTLARREVRRDDAVTRKVGLRKPGAAPNDERALAAWEAKARYWAVDFDIPEGETRIATFYLADPDTMMRRVAPFAFTDRKTGAKLDARQFDRFGNGLHVRYEISGSVRLTLEYGRHWLKAGVSGLFLDAGPEGSALAGNAVKFLGIDEAAGGDWEGRFGALGRLIAGVDAPDALADLGVTIPDEVSMVEHKWPAEVRRYSYRMRPVLPAGNAPNFDNIQLAFNALPASEKPTLEELPGTMPKFVAYADTDYEYALNTIREEDGGGVEVLRLRYPGMPGKHFYPRQDPSPFDGPAPGAQFVARREGDQRIVECAIPWTEIPAVKARLDAGEPLKFSYRVNDDGGSGLCMELSRGRSVAKRNGSFKADWVEHWANELEFGWGE